jgi:glycosyltransferase involved in cell wall biosynthesis
MTSTADSQSSLRPPRIGIDVSAAMTQGGGIGRYTRELVRAVAQRAPEFDYRLFSVRPPPQLPVADPLPAGDHIRYRQLPLSGQWLYRLWHRLRLPLPVQLATGRIDLFHSPDFVLPPVAGHVPTLLTVHDLSFLHFPEAYDPALVRFLNSAVRRSVAQATHLLADSAATRADLVSFWNIDPARITVLYCGVDPGFSPVADPARVAAVRDRYGLGRAPYLLSVGTVQPRKNYSLLVEALALLAARYPHQLVIAGGRGWRNEGLRATIAAAGLGDRVCFTGFVDDDDLPALYCGADLYLQSSLYEGFGIPLLEAMACGLPVISSNASSLPEVAGRAAVLLPPADPVRWAAAIDSLLGNEARRHALAAAGRTQAARFRWDESADALAQVYRDLLS